MRTRGQSLSDYSLIFALIILVSISAAQVLANTIKKQSDQPSPALHQNKS